MDWHSGHATWIDKCGNPGQAKDYSCTMAKVLSFGVLLGSTVVGEIVVSTSPPVPPLDRRCEKNPLHSKHVFVSDSNGQDGGKTAEEANIRGNNLNKRLVRGYDDKRCSRIPYAFEWAKSESIVYQGPRIREVGHSRH